MIRRASWSWYFAQLALIGALAFALGLGLGYWAL